MIKYHIISEDVENEILLAFLTTSKFESFELIENGLFAYLGKHGFQNEVEEVLKALQNKFLFNYTKEELVYQNWNEIWESNFKPVLVDDFCIIRADFHEKQEGFEHEIILRPKMAFGTGHHETSFMMLKMMRNINFFQKNVLDYGSGTGILSIIASYKGAKTILAVDIQEESYLNTIENAINNNVSNITSVHGKLSDIEAKQQYDVILANINRKVLLDSAHSIVQYCKQPTKLLLSGILRTDVDLVRKSYQDVGFEFKEMMFKGEWVSMLFYFENDDEDGYTIIGQSII